MLKKAGMVFVRVCFGLKTDFFVRFLMIAKATQSNQIFKSIPYKKTDYQ
ncbi:hypothetical protein [Flavobacterium magnum]|nr:hypothetical protein [Flavobacterium magnum]